MSGSGIPVVIVASGGIPVILVPDGGVPVNQVTANGIPVTVAPSYGLPITVISGLVFTVQPAITGTLLVGQVLSCSTGTAAGTGTVTYARQWTRNGANISGATGATYTLQSADDGTTIGCRIAATDDNGSTVALATGGGTVTYAAPTFSVQPAFGAGSYASGATVTFTEGIAGPAATLTIEQFDLSGVDKRSELVGTSWDSTGEAAGTISLRVRATNSGGTVLSNVVTAALAAAAPTAPALTGPLTVSDPAGDTSYSVDVGSRQYWALFASGTSWTAADILTGTGAADFGYFDAASGVVNHSETFASGLNLTGATLAFVARVEGSPPSALSNTLTATVTVNTVAAGITLVSSANILAAGDNYNNVDVPAPVGWAIGDRHVIIAWVNGTTRPAAVPAGYTEAASYAISQSVKVFQRVLDGSEAWPLNIVNSPSTFAAWNVESLLYRGSSGIGATAANSAFINAGSSKPSPALTVSAGSDVVYSFAKSTTGTITTLSGVAETIQAVTGTGIHQIVGRNTAVTAGAAPTASAALTVANNTIVAMAVEILA